MRPSSSTVVRVGVGCPLHGKVQKRRYGYDVVLSTVGGEHLVVIEDHSGPNHMAGLLRQLADEMEEAELATADR